MQIGNMGGMVVVIDLRLEGAAGRIPDVSILLLSTVRPTASSRSGPTPTRSS